MIHSARPGRQWLSLDFEVLGRTYVGTDNLCENSGHYRPGFWSASWIKKKIRVVPFFTFFRFYAAACIHRTIPYFAFLPHIYRKQLLIVRTKCHMLWGLYFVSVGTISYHKCLIYVEIDYLQLFIIIAKHLIEISYIYNMSFTYDISAFTYDIWKSVLWARNTRYLNSSNSKIAMKSYIRIQETRKNMQLYSISLRKKADSILYVHWAS